MEGSLIVAALAGAAGAGLMLTGRALSLQLDPRPCWQKSDCALKRADADACERCPVYQYRDVPLEEFVTPELALPPLRTFGANEAAKAA